MTTARLFQIEEPAPPRPQPSEAAEARRRQLALDAEECEPCAWMVDEAAEYWSAEMGDDFTAMALMYLASRRRAEGHPDCYWMADVYDYDRPPDYGGFPGPLPERMVPEDFTEGLCANCDYLHMMARHWYAAGFRCVAIRLLGHLRHSIAIEHLGCWSNTDSAESAQDEPAEEPEQAVEREAAVQQSMF